ALLPKPRGAPAPVDSAALAREEPGARDLPAAPEEVDRPSGPRPHAVAADFEITADSLDVLAPSEALERIFAAGRARSISHGRDSLNADVLPELARTDWLEGDTLVVTFVPEIAEE